MSKTTCRIVSGSVEETEAIAATVGERLQGGEVIELISDLGGGKTAFTRGLAKGFGSNDRVASPTFTVSRVYKSGAKELHHFDFYRLDDAGLMEYELHGLMSDPLVVIVIEWGGVVQDVLPKERLTVRIKNAGETERQLEFECPNKLKYLLEGVAC